VTRLGEALRAQREQRGIDLEQAAEDTRIRRKFLEALEASDYQSLPGAVYTKGFLRNYADYLDLDSDDLIALYRADRGTPEAPRPFEPIRPIMRRHVTLTPAVLLPLLTLAGIGLFAAYLYYQLSSFALPPRLEVYDPQPDALAQRAEHVVRGRTVPQGRLTIRVSPGAETVTDLRPAADGTFAAAVNLKPGPNQLEVEVLDPAGKVNKVSRTVRLELGATAQVPQLIVEQPANGGTYTNTPVAVSGRVDRSVASLTINGQPVEIGSDGRFAMSVQFTAGPQTLRFVARSASGGEVTETRNVSVTFTAAVVTVTVQGGDAWILALVDGAQAPSTGRVLRSGTSATFSGREVRIQTGNAGATNLVYNGQMLGRMGEQGQVAERSFRAQ
jgi:cytoskeletal protein RodZ